MDWTLAISIIFLQSTLSQFTDKKSSSSFLKSRHKRETQCKKYTSTEDREEGVMQRAANFKKECVFEVVWCDQPCKYEEFLNSARDDKSLANHKEYNVFDIYKVPPSEHRNKYQLYQDYFNRKLCQTSKCKNGIVTDSPRPTTQTQVSIESSGVVSPSIAQSENSLFKLVEERWYYIVVPGLVALLLIFILVSVRCKRKSKKNQLSQAQPLIRMQLNSNGSTTYLSPEIESKIKENADKIIKYKNLKMKEHIADGHFGRVDLASYNGENVAVKGLKNIQSNAQIESFLKEGFMMCKFNHENVIGILGLCVEKTDDGLPLLVMPFMKEGALLTFLRDKKRNKQDFAQLGQFCIDIAQGISMSF